MDFQFKTYSPTLPGYGKYIFHPYSEKYICAQIFGVPEELCNHAVGSPVSEMKNLNEMGVIGF